jgi:hypothetical protein
MASERSAERWLVLTRSVENNFIRGEKIIRAEHVQKAAVYVKSLYASAKLHHLLETFQMKSHFVWLSNNTLEKREISKLSDSNSRENIPRYLRGEERQKWSRLQWKVEGP